MEEKFKKLDCEQKWDDLFIMLGTRSNAYPTNEAERPTNEGRNRYLNILPFDRSRVKLKRIVDSDYINANMVTVPKAARKYILTQGPLPTTLGHFWLMVWEQKSSVIVMLNKVIEVGDFAKCEEYWPKEIGKTDEYEYANLSVTLKNVQDLKHYTVREMLLEDMETRESRNILQFQHTSWPDHGHPESPTSLLRLITAVRRAGGLYKMDEPTIVHCSAGVGRSGTFCLIDAVLNMVESQGSTEGIDIDNTLIEMRDYRQGLVQSTVQLKFAYMTIIYGIKILEKANKLHPHISICQDNLAFDNGSSSQQQRANGSSQNNGKKPRKNKKRQNNSSNTGSLNIFEKNLLADALDDIDSDSADSLFEEAMKPWPDMKKARNSAPDESKNFKDVLASGARESNDPNSQQQLSAEVKVRMMDQVIHSLLNPMISTNSSSPIDGSSEQTSPEKTDSALLRRRERELKNQRLEEKTREMVRKMKEDATRREISSYRWSVLKKSALFGGVAALLLSSVVYYMR